MLVCVCVCVCTRPYMFAYACLCLHMLVHLCTCLYMFARARTWLHIYYTATNTNTETNAITNTSVSPTNQIHILSMLWSYGPTLVRCVQQAYAGESFLDYVTKQCRLRCEGRCHLLAGCPLALSTGRFPARLAHVQLRHGAASASASTRARGRYHQVAHVLDL